MTYLSYRQFATVQSPTHQAWAQCEAAADCVKVDEFCGAISTINRQFIEEHRQSFQNKVGKCTGKEDFSSLKAMRPSCVGKVCVLVP